MKYADGGALRFGEADFVVLVPGHDIVCVEAKTYLARTTDGSLAHRRVRPADRQEPLQAGE